MTDEFAPFSTLRYWWRWKQFLDWQSFGSVGLSPNFVVVEEGGSKAKSSEKNSPWGFENSPTTRYIVQLLFIINHIVCSTYIAQQKTVTLFGIKWNPALFIVISAKALLRGEIPSWRPQKELLLVSLLLMTQTKCRINVSSRPWLLGLRRKWSMIDGLDPD